MKTVKDTKAIVKEEDSSKDLMDWLLSEVAIKNKRELVKNVAKAFDEGIIVVMERRKPKGVFINLDRNKARKLPPEVRAFLSTVLNTAGCKLMRESENDSIL
jgi:hypothetical protein